MLFFIKLRQSLESVYGIYAILAISVDRCSGDIMTHFHSLTGVMLKEVLNVPFMVMKDVTVSLCDLQ